MDTLRKVLICGVIPLLTVVVISVVKRSRLRMAPLISTVLAFTTYVVIFDIAAGVTIVDLLGNIEWRVWCFMAMVLQLIIVTIFTAIAWGILKRKKS